MSKKKKIQTTMVINFFEDSGYTVELTGQPIDGIRLIGTLDVVKNDINNRLRGSKSFTYGAN